MNSQETTTTAQRMLTPQQTATQVNDANTSIIRLVYLSSKLSANVMTTATNIPIYASSSLDTTTNAAKRFNLPPINRHHSGSVKYKINLRGLDILHVWPNVKTALTLVTSGGTATIARGNWTATDLATYLSGLVGITTCTYDPKTLGFTFSPAINILAGTTAQGILGFPSGYTGTGITASTVPINLLGPSQINVNSNLSLYTLPISGCLASLPITGSYGSLLSFRDLDGQQPMLVTHSELQNLHITLADENNTTLEGYEDIPWRLILSIELIHDQGYVNPGEQHGVGLVPMTIPQTQKFYQQLGSYKA